MNYLEKIEAKVKAGSIIYIDFDDTLIDFINGWFKNIRHKELSYLTMLPNKKDEVDSFRFFKVDKTGAALSSLSNPLVYEDIEVLPFANDFIEMIKRRFGDDSFKIITTSYGESIIEAKNKNLKNLFDIETDKIIHTHYKIDIVKKHILIDDAIHNVKELGDETLVFMPTQPWNIRYKEKIKINNLSELL